MRHKTVRSRVSTKAQKRTSTEEQLRAIRALYIVVYNGETSIIPCATELFHTLGDILEGTPIEELELHRVSKQKILDTYVDLGVK